MTTQLLKRIQMNFELGLKKVNHMKLNLKLPFVLLLNLGLASTAIAGDPNIDGEGRRGDRPQSRIKTIYESDLSALIYGFKITRGRFIHKDIHLHGKIPNACSAMITLIPKCDRDENKVTYEITEKISGGLKCLRENKYKCSDDKNKECSNLDQISKQRDDREDFIAKFETKNNPVSCREVEAKTADLQFTLRSQPVRTVLDSEGSVSCGCELTKSVDLPTSDLGDVVARVGPRRAAPDEVADLKSSRRGSAIDDDDDDSDRRPRRTYNRSRDDRDDDRDYRRGDRDDDYYADSRYERDSRSYSRSRDRSYSDSASGAVRAGPAVLPNQGYSQNYNQNYNGYLNAQTGYPYAQSQVYNPYLYGQQSRYYSSGNNSSIWSTLLGMFTGGLNANVNIGGGANSYLYQPQIYPYYRDPSQYYNLTGNTTTTGAPSTWSFVSR